ncbi:hypothetical protein F5Y15DRAFT_241166 [Xylariaceae sp. FL0016]|nr:hypothetical protein F5Y15DRAFT_241166 [Xylariaceae sp. FL0016]
MASITARIQDEAGRNTELLGILAATDFAGPALEQQNQYVADLDRELRDVNKRIRVLDEEREKELKDHEKYRDSVMKRFAYRVSGKSDKFVAKAEKEEREYFDVLQKAHKASGQKENLEGMRSEAVAARNDLEAQVARHSQAQRDLDGLYDSIFTGPTPEFPEEDTSEKSAGQALQTYHDSRVRMETELRVVNTLMDASRRLHDALSFLEEALDYSRMDMFGGGSMTDMMERNALSKSERQVSQVMLLVAQAQRMSPDVQNLPQPRIAEGSLMSDVFFDNIFTDAAFHDKIKDSRNDVHFCGRVLSAQLTNAQSRYHACEQEVRQNSATLNQARLDLQNARERIFERINSGQGVQSQTKTASGLASADAPPPY